MKTRKPSNSFKKACVALIKNAANEAEKDRIRKALDASRLAAKPESKES